jgi:holo-[acyl-carrier protein] synthase
MIVGLGIDAIDIARIERMIEGKKDRVLRRLFSEGELRYVDSKIAPAQHIAVRLAAKEAAYKALAGNELARGIGWRDVEVLTRDDGSPELLMHGRAAQRFAEIGATRSHVSLTHSQATAVAVVILEG